MEWSAVLEAIKATSDAQTCLKGLKRLQGRLESEEASVWLERMFEASPDCKEILAVWHSQSLIKEHEVAESLLLVLAQVLRKAPAQLTNLSPVRGLADNLAGHILDQKVRKIMFALGSEHKVVVAAALFLMDGIAQRGQIFVSRLLNAFDFSLPAFTKANKASRLEKAGDESNLPAPDTYWLWRSDRNSKRPLHALIAQLLLSFLSTTNPQLLLKTLNCKPLVEGVFGNVSSHPPEFGRKLLEEIKSLLTSKAVGISSSAYAAFFSHSLLTELASCAALKAGVDEHTEELATLAFEILSKVTTNPSYGLLTVQLSSETQLSGGPGVLQAWMMELKPANHPTHFKLLEGMFKANASLAREFTKHARFDTSPRLESEWLAIMSILSLSCRHSIAHISDQGKSAPRENRPVSIGSLFPACLSKVNLTKGLQHRDNLVQFTTCTTLRSMTNAISHCLEVQGWDDKAHNPDSSVEGNDDSSNDESSTTDKEVQRLLMSNLPDLKVLQTLYNKLDAAILSAKPNPAGGGDKAPSKDSPDAEEGDRLTAPMLTMLVLLDLFDFYLNHIGPETTSFHCSLLLTKGVLSWPGVLQQALGRLLEKQADWTGWAPNQTQLQLLLTLGMRQWASWSKSVLKGMGVLLGMSHFDLGLTIWLNRCRGCWTRNQRQGEDVVDFLATTTMACTRKAIALYESLLEQNVENVSILSIAALKQLSRVVTSTKMAPESKTAITAFVAESITAITKLQSKPASICRFFCTQMDCFPGLQSPAPSTGLKTDSNTFLSTSAGVEAKDHLSSLFQFHILLPVILETDADSPKEEEGSSNRARKRRKTDNVEDTTRGTPFRSCSKQLLKAALDLTSIPDPQDDDFGLSRSLVKYASSFEEQSTHGSQQAHILQQYAKAGELEKSAVLQTCLFWMSLTDNLPIFLELLLALLQASSTEFLATYADTLLKHPTLIKLVAEEQRIDTEVAHIAEVVGKISASKIKVKDGESAMTTDEDNFYLEWALRRAEAQVLDGLEKKSPNFPLLVALLQYLPPGKLEEKSSVLVTLFLKVLDVPGYNMNPHSKFRWLDEGTIEEAINLGLVLVLRLGLDELLRKVTEESTQGLEYRRAFKFFAKLLEMPGQETRICRHLGQSASHLLQSVFANRFRSSPTKAQYLIGLALTKNVETCRRVFAPLALELANNPGQSRVGTGPWTPVSWYNFESLFPAAKQVVDKVSLDSNLDGIHELGELLRDKLLLYFCSPERHGTPLEDVHASQVCETLVLCMAQLPPQRKTALACLHRATERPLKDDPSLEYTLCKMRLIKILYSYLGDPTLWDKVTRHFTHTIMKSIIRSQTEAPKKAALDSEQALELLMDEVVGWMDKSTHILPVLQFTTAQDNHLGQLLRLATVTLLKNFKVTASLTFLCKYVKSSLGIADDKAEYLLDGGDFGFAEGFNEEFAGKTTVKDFAWKFLGLIIGHSQFEKGISGKHAWEAETIAELSTGGLKSVLVASTSPACPPREFVDHEEWRLALLSLLQIALKIYTAATSHDSADDSRATADPLELQKEHLKGLQVSLLGSFGATVSRTDQAILSCLTLVGQLLNRESSDSSSLEGRLATSIFPPGLWLWGQLAHKAASLCAATEEERAKPAYQHAVRTLTQLQVDQIEAGRISNSVCHMPDQTESEAEADGLTSLSYNPVILLQFCQQALEAEALRMDAAIQSGILSFCLRSLSCQTDHLRAMSQDCVLLFQRLLSDPSTRIRGQPHFEKLLSLAMASCGTPNTDGAQDSEVDGDGETAALPTLTTVFLAEAVIALTQPGSSIGRAVEKWLNKTTELSLQRLPLFKRMIESTVQEEQEWIMKMLIAGFQSEASADICRKQFVAEVLMTWHSSSLAQDSLQNLIEVFLCKVSVAPHYAIDLVRRAGLVPWLSKALQRTLAAGKGSVPIMEALQRLWELHPWHKNPLGPLQDFHSAACACLQAVTGHLKAAGPEGMQQGVEFLAVSAMALCTAVFGALKHQREWGKLSKMTLFQAPTADLIALQMALDHVWRTHWPGSIQRAYVQIITQTPLDATDESANSILQSMVKVLTGLADPDRSPEGLAEVSALRQSLAWSSVSLDAGLYVNYSTDEERQSAALNVLSLRLHEKLLSVPVVKLAVHILFPLLSRLVTEGSCQGLSVEEKRGEAVRRFFIGNTLQTLLHALDLPEFGDPEGSWPPPGHISRSRDPEAGDNSNSSTETEELSVSKQAIAEVTAVALEELALNVPPFQAMETMAHWRGDEEPPELQNLANAEFRTAELMGLKLC